MGIATKKTEEKKTEQVKPIETFRAGSLSVSIWEQKQIKDNKEYVFYSLTMQRGYKDKDGNWKNTQSFKPQDAPKIIMLMNKAYEFIYFTDIDRIE